MARLRNYLPLLLLCLAPAIGGCQIADDLIYGTKSKPPDEFQVVNQPPLSLPPDYGLRPPKPGAGRPNELEPAERSRRAIFGIKDDRPYGMDAASAANRSPGELAVLNRSGAARPDPNIRRILNEESGTPAENDRNFAEELLFLGEEDKKDEAVLDPVEEYRRIYGQPLPSAPGTATEDDEPTFGYE